MSDGRAMDFDPAFYLARNPDVAAAGVDALTHWRTTGWREGRDPHPAFDTRFYLARLGGAPTDGLDPLSHYDAIGRAEGRPTAPPPDPALRAIARRLNRPEPSTPASAETATLDRSRLVARLRPALVGRARLLLSIGHDAFVRSVGGVQLVTAIEARRCAQDGGRHLHLSPVTAQPGLRPLAGPAVLLVVLLDGVDIGTATMATVARALTACETPAPRVVVHSLLGHRPEEVAALADVVSAPITVWLHDYATLCPSPQLLRNGHVFCGAPPVASTACAVCVEGPTRADVVARCLALCRRAEVVAPSETARDLWAAAAGMDPAAIAVRPHVQLDTLARESPLPRRDGVARVAFAGTPVFHKGHCRAIELAAMHPELAWFTVGVAPSIAGAIHLPARAAADDPDATARALERAAIDLVLVLSPWPETFCLVAHEAIAAGCDILTLAGSGHPATLVRETGRGVVFADVAAVGRWFRDDSAAWVARRRADPPARRALTWR